MQVVRGKIHLVVCLDCLFFPLIMFLMMMSLGFAAADIFIWWFFQVILIYLLVISALRLQMLHCLHAFLFTPVVRKFVFLIFCLLVCPFGLCLNGLDMVNRNSMLYNWEQLVLASLTYLSQILQGCTGYVGPENWTFEGLWFCCFSEWAGFGIVTNCNMTFSPFLNTTLFLPI